MKTVILDAKMCLKTVYFPDFFFHVPYFHNRGNVSGVQMKIILTVGPVKSHKKSQMQRKHIITIKRITIKYVPSSITTSISQ